MACEASLGYPRVWLCRSSSDEAGQCSICSRDLGVIPALCAGPRHVIGERTTAGMMFFILVVINAWLQAPNGGTYREPHKEDTSIKFGGV